MYLTYSPSVDAWQDALSLQPLDNDNGSSQRWYFVGVTQPTYDNSYGAYSAERPSAIHIGKENRCKAAVYGGSGV